MALITRRRWLQEGLALLEEAGAEALTIESLTSRLDVTKGSFYHHFTNYQDFQESLLVFWEEEGTLRIVQLAEKEASPPEKLERVLQASLQPSRLDVALRAWAWQDERVRERRFLPCKIPYRMVYSERESYSSAKEEGKSDGAYHQAQMVTRRAGSS